MAQVVRSHMGGGVIVGVRVKPDEGKAAPDVFVQLSAEPNSEGHTKLFSLNRVLRDYLLLKTCPKQCVAAP